MLLRAYNSFTNDSATGESCYFTVMRKHISQTAKTNKPAVIISPFYLYKYIYFQSNLASAIRLQLST